MCDCLDRLLKREKATAKIVEDVLILSLPHALTPQVWRLDLEAAKNSALEVWAKDEEGGSSVFILGQKTDKNSKNEIASFSDKDAAVQALMAASRAMTQGAVVKTAAVVSSGGGETVLIKQGKGGKIVTVFVGFVLLVFLVLMFVNMGGQSVRYATQSGQGDGNIGGVPMAADEFLMNRQ